MPDFKAAIFDLDGTLIDSMRVWNKIDIDFLAKRNLPIPAHYAEELSAKGFRQAAEYTIRVFGLNEEPEAIMAEWHRMAIDEYSLRVPLKPHAKEYLAYLKKQGVLLGVATALGRALYKPVLENNGVFTVFNAIASTDEVKFGKERPDIYFLAAEKLGVAANDCIVFEDVLPAVLSAKAAGMTVCGVYDDSSAFQKDRIQKASDRYIFDFAELL